MNRLRTSYDMTISILRMTKKDMHLSTLARSFGIMTITVEDTGTAEEDSRSAPIGHTHT